MDTILKNFLSKRIKFPKDYAPTSEIICLKTEAKAVLEMNKIMDVINGFTFCLVTEGEVSLQYRTYNVVMKELQLFLAYPGTKVKITDISDNFRCYLFFVPEKDVFQNPFSRNIIRHQFLEKVRNGQPSITLDTQTYMRVNNILQELEDTISYLQPYRREASGALFTLFMIELVKLQRKKESLAVVKTKKESKVIALMNLIRQNFRKEHSIGYYADKLCVSSVYLSRITKEMTDLTVMQHIERMMVIEASRLLKSSDLSILEIAESLSFADQASFSKFFKRKKGISPNAYRQKEHL